MRTIFFSLTALICGLAIANPIKSNISTIGMRYIDRNEDGWDKSTAKNYVQDGILAHWDGIENIGWGKHSSNTLVWKDLVGGNDFTIVDKGVEFKPNFVHLPARKGVAYANLYDRSEIRTIECLVRLSGHNGLVLCGLAWPNVSTYYRWIGFRANSTFNFGHVQQCAEMGNVQNEIVLYTGITDDDGHWWLYKNGVKMDNKGSGMSFGSISNGKALLNAAASSFSESDIFRITLYSRILTADEVAHNYALDKERFGL